MRLGCIRFLTRQMWFMFDVVLLSRVIRNELMWKDAPNTLYNRFVRNCSPWLCEQVSGWCSVERAA
jgi:hypothetical protein